MTAISAQDWAIIAGMFGALIALFFALDRYDRRHRARRAHNPIWDIIRHRTRRERRLTDQRDDSQK